MNKAFTVDIRGTDEVVFGLMNGIYSENGLLAEVGNPNANAEGIRELPGVYGIRKKEYEKTAAENIPIHVVFS